jgi:probable phosphoglycerate mutase
MEEEYLWVKREFEALLKKHGDEREEDSLLFKAVRPNRDTVVLFCHFGLMGLLMSILTGFSPYVFWQHFCAAPSSVTTIATEEREDGKAIFRCLSYGDISHLNIAGEPPAFAARFCETFDSDERH